MTPELILSLLCKLTATVDAQQAQIEALQAEIARLTPEDDSAASTGLA